MSEGKGESEGGMGWDGMGWDGMGGRIKARAREPASDAASEGERACDGYRPANFFSGFSVLVGDASLNQPSRGAWLSSSFRIGMCSDPSKSSSPSES